MTQHRDIYGQTLEDMTFAPLKSVNVNRHHHPLQYFVTGLSFRHYSFIHFGTFAVRGLDRV